MSPRLGRGQVAPVVAWSSGLKVIRGAGATITAADGSEYLDFTSGTGVVNTGHCHPRVVEAIREAAGVFIHANIALYRHPYLEGAVEKLAEITPKGIDTFFFANSGAEGIEAAVKLARQATRRGNIVVFEGAFHGRTLQATAMSSSKVSFRAGYGPLAAGIAIAPYPYPFRAGRYAAREAARCLGALRRILEMQTAPAETAAIVVEPVLGEGGYIFPPESFLQGLEAICTEHDLLLIFDEVQSGMGRTGRFFALEHVGVIPDILVMAKGLGSGVPIAAVGARGELMDCWPLGSHGSTFGGNPIACAAASATVEIIKEEGLLQNAEERGQQLMKALRTLQGQDRSVGDVRGLGLMIGVEIVDSAGQPDRGRVQGILEHCRTKGRVILQDCGTDRNVIRIIPPLVVSEGEVERAITAIEDAVDATSRAR